MSPKSSLGACMICGELVHDLVTHYECYHPEEPETLRIWHPGRVDRPEEENYGDSA